jgi:hypothetical protein
VAVNGQELSHHWEGRFSSGSGSIPPGPSNASAELQATWQSICVAAPLGAPHKQNAHIFTLVFDNDRNNALEDDIGFTVSFGGYDEVEVLRVSNFPMDLSHGSEWEEWRHSGDDIEHIDSALDYSGLASFATKLEAELQKLEVLQYELQLLQNSVTLQEKKIRHLLKKDCEPLLTKWQKCDGFFCYLKSSWQKVPEFYWSVRYRFGLLGSGRINPICRPVPEQPSNHDNTHSPSPSAASSHPVPTPSKHLLPTYLGNTPSPSSTPNVSTTLVSTTHLPPAITPPPPQKPDTNFDSEPKANHPDSSATEVILPIPSPTKHFLRSCAILLLIVLVFGLCFRLIGHSTAFRRRRRDLASRQEELRARRAYRNAARRLRWRQWWEGRSYFQAGSVTSSHTLAEFEHARGVNPDDEGNRRPSVHDNDNSYSASYTLSEDASEEPADRGLMQNEILGLRRVLEYVGELVGAEGTTSSSSRRRLRSRSRSRPPPYEDVAGHARRNSANHRDSDIHPSAMASASGGLGSPPASTMFSLETGSRITLETIDTLDSGPAPPSYHT